MRTFPIFNRSGARAARTLAVAALLPAVLLSGLGAAPTMAAGPGAGQLDPTFGKGGKVTVDFGSTLDQADGVAIQPDGKIVAVGEAWPKPDGQPRFIAVRLNKDGSLDKTFDKDGQAQRRHGRQRPGLGHTAAARRQDPRGRSRRRQGRQRRQ